MCIRANFWFGKTFVRRSKLPDNFGFVLCSHEMLQHFSYDNFFFLLFYLNYNTHAHTEETKKKFSSLFYQDGMELIVPCSMVIPFSFEIVQSVCQCLFSAMEILNVVHDKHVPARIYLHRLNHQIHH